MRRLLTTAALAVATLGLLCAPDARAAVSGKARVVDAGEIVVAGTRIRLHGVLAPAWDLTCTREGRPWHCGMEAASALAFFIGSNWVDCVERGRDRDGVVTAVCYAGGAAGGPEINAWLVSRGWALAHPRRGVRYDSMEEEARAAGRGLWRGAVPPALRRRGEGQGAKAP